jgi:hypothetical protein
MEALTAHPVPDYRWQHEAPTPFWMHTCGTWVECGFSSVALWALDLGWPICLADRRGDLPVMEEVK